MIWANQQVKVKLEPFATVELSDAKDQRMHMLALFGSGFFA
jgi:hypothetical protein